MKKIKLWQKFLLSCGFLGALTTLVAMGLHLYSNSDIAKGEKHSSSEPLGVDLENIKNIKKYNISFRDPINTNVIIGKYEMNLDENNGNFHLQEGKINNKPANQWIEEYYKENKQSPVMYVYIGGGIKFTNFYTESILPSDYILFVNWFSKNISWDPGIANISSFSLKKGIKYNGKSLIFGSFESEQGEKKSIEFFPDSFFKKQSILNYISKINKIPLTKVELLKLIQYINKENNKKTSGKIYPYSAEKLNSGKYNLYISNAGFSVIKALDKMYSNKSKVSNIDISVDAKGKVKIKNQKSFKISSALNISKLTALRAFASKSKWKGIGLNFLKYTTAHEYGHMLTLSMSRSAANNPISLGPSTNVVPNAGMTNGQVNIDILNLYFQARLPFIKAVRVSPILFLDPNTKKYRFRTYKEALENAKKNNSILPSKDDFMNVAFEVIRNHKSQNIKKDLLNIDKIFAGSNDPTDKNNMLFNNSNTKDPKWLLARKDIIDEIKNGIISEKKRFLFLMSGVEDIEAFADFLGVPTAAIAFINANDNFLATTSPRFSVFDSKNRIPLGRQMEQEGGKWVLDNVFNIKTRNAKKTNVHWFTDDPNKISLISPITNIKYTKISLADLKIISKHTKKVWYINPNAAIANGAPIDTEVNLKKYIDNFKKWFIKRIAIQSNLAISGNDRLYKSFDSWKVSSYGIKVFGNANMEAVKEVFELLNDKNIVSETKSTVIKGNPILIDELNVKTGQDFLNFLRTYKRLPTVYPVAGVINGKRVINLNAYENFSDKKRKYKFLRSGILEFYKLMGSRDILNQKLFYIFSNNRRKKWFILKDEKGKNLTSILSSRERNVNKWINEVIRVFGGAKYISAKMRAYIINPSKKPSTRILVSKILIAKKIISKAKSIMFNIYHPRFKYANQKKFKSFSFTAFFKLFFLDINNTKMGRINFRSGNSIPFVGLKDLSDYTSSAKNKVFLNWFISEKLFIGFQDFMFSKENIGKLLKLFKKMGVTPLNPLQSDEFKNMFGDMLKQYFDKKGNFDWKNLDSILNNFISEVNSYNLSKVSNNPNESIKTFSAMQFILNDLYLKLKKPKYYRDFVKVSIKPKDWKRPNLIKWVDNPWDGYTSTLKRIHSNYNNLWSELLTRDWVQMTYVPNFNKDDQLSKNRYGSQYTNILEGNTGIRLYFDPKKSLDKNGETYKWLNQTKFRDEFIKTIDDLKGLIRSDSSKDNTLKSLSDKIVLSKVFSKIYANFSNAFSIHSINNGSSSFYKDKWLRTILKDKKSISGKTTSFSIYDENGDPIIDPNISIKKPNIKSDGKIFFEKLVGSEQNRAYSFWWWLLGSYGVGNRTITGLWRAKEKDAISMWGYIPTSLAKKIKYIQIRKGSEVKYIPVKTRGTNNLFYFKKQGHKLSKHVLSDDGFSSWTVDYITMGSWYNSVISEGEWTIKFVDKNKNEVKDPNNKTKNAFTLGDKNKPGWLEFVTENNKPASYAPIKIITDDKGETILVVKSGFNI